MASKAEGKTVALAGAPAGVTLSSHVGHTVAITGTIGAGAASSPTGTTGSTPSASPGAAPSSSASSASAGGPALNVTGFKMVSGTCPM
jgi:hypothetical protein